MKQYLNVKIVGALVGVLFLLLWLVGFYWSFEPDTFDVKENTHSQMISSNAQPVPGYTVTTTLITVASTLMDKPGGYLSNDVMPPSVFLDNMPSWEFGALEMVRDMSLSMRKDFSRSQSQSVENPHLVKAQPKFNIDNRSWLFPSAESQYSEAIEFLIQYRDELADPTLGDSQFYTRADNLREYLKQVEKRLGSLSQRLSASVESERVNTDLAGDKAASNSTPRPNSVHTRTSWWQLDNVFYEARGATWALLHLLKAIEADFSGVLENKNALVSLQQIIKELEASQQTIWSPMILNGSGFGMLANHSLVMANYISRANAAIIELSELLNQG
ncbi:DUF2333 family protein [Alteromonas lipolytica]|uniref:DUF2333 domain-containing protein n=1 Tax=Alteromonas lipolytica TaxID=1856405 RepID=A0A1E8FCB1_9ALTE|nr:DUF2333 family protein [Alteromonas lipolytica]OFI33545.1 hypothetical protein BFC17_04620 [Alteromonas lipolytica]GGF58778.1 hypothetical protein GCM10011338_08760 [Alteromonas lipolytica]